MHEKSSAEGGPPSSYAEATADKKGGTTNFFQQEK